MKLDCSAKKIDLLYTNIGRGHPFYLDGIAELLQLESDVAFESTDIFEVSHGLTRLTWKIARWLYRKGSTESIVGRWYKQLRDRSDYNKNSVAMRFMGRDCRSRFIEKSTPLIVAHPVLVGLLQGKSNLVYQHGEIAVPPQALVKGAKYVFAPTEKAAKPFIQSGYKAEQVIVTGLCVEPSLLQKSEQAFHDRVKRMKSGGSLTGAFYSSGAEPQAHISSLISAVISAVRSGGRAIVCALKDGKLDRQIRITLTKQNIDFIVVTGAQAIDSEAAPVILCNYESRQQESVLTSRMFENFDYLVAPSHERSNWALGLGLPMFILEPTIGPFAPLNRQVLIESGVAELLDSDSKVDNFGDWLKDLQAGLKLSQMSESGWGKYDITGFRVIVDFLVNKYLPNA